MIGKPARYCPACGGSLEERLVEPDNKLRRACVSCDYVYYNNPTPAAGVILIEDSRVLLVERKFEPRAGMWTLPAGFMEAEEDAAACAVRETNEETGLDVKVVRLFDVYTALDDPRAAVVLILYVARRLGGELRCGDDASDAGFFALDHLPDNIAFKAHQRALADIVTQVEAGLL